MIIIKIIKFIFCFIFLYTSIFIFTLIATNITKFYFRYRKMLIQKEQELKFRPQQKIKQEKTLNKKWNNVLGVWEIED